jgi:hypothetical protein
MVEVLEKEKEMWLRIGPYWRRGSRPRGESGLDSKPSRGELSKLRTLPGRGFGPSRQSPVVDTCAVALDPSRMRVRKVVAGSG